MLHDCSGFVSGSADKEVKFWEWAIVEQDGTQARQLTVNNTRTLNMTDEVLCVRISPNGMLRCAMLPRILWSGSANNFVIALSDCFQCPDRA